MDRTVPAGAALLLEFVYEIETSRRPPECYRVVYGHNQAKLPKPITSMTVDEWIAAGRGWTKRFGSSAAGAPQFMRATLADLKRELGLRGSQVMDPDLQPCVHSCCARQHAGSAGRQPGTLFLPGIPIIAVAPAPAAAPRRRQHRQCRSNTRVRSCHSAPEQTPPA